MSNGIGRRLLALAFAVVLQTSLAGCAFQQHEVAITAAAPVIQSRAGEGVKVALRVFDDRDTKTVGQRGAGMVGADIKATMLMNHLQTEVTKGLVAQGFTVLPSGSTEADASLLVSLRSFKFFIEMGFWTGANNVAISIKADANRAGKSDLNAYQFDSEERSMVVPTGAGIDEALNAGLSDVLKQMFADQAMVNFLAGH